MTSSSPRNRFLLLLVALAAAMTASSSFVPHRQTCAFGSRIIVRSKQQSFSPLLIHPKKSMPRRQSKTSSSSSCLQAGIFPHDFLSSYDTLMIAAQQQAVQQELARTSTNLLSTYSHLLQVHPITTKATTAAILAATGDAIAQWRSTSAAYDFRRGAGFLLFGALYTGTFQHYWFNYMSQNIGHWGDMLHIWGPERVAYPVDYLFDATGWWKYFDIVHQLEKPPSPQALAAAKVALNQLVVIPLIYMPLFFAFTGLVSGLDAKESEARARSLYFPILQRNWFYWLPMQFLQFLVIPVDFQIPFVSAASLVWTIILSSIGSGSTAPSAASSIIVYDTQQQDEFGQDIVTVSKVEPGPANQITDDVLLEDVEKALFPELLREVVSDTRTQLATGGLATGLLAAAADEGVLGAAVGGAVVGAAGGVAGTTASVGVAVVAAVGAGLGLLAASNMQQHNNHHHHHHAAHVVNNNNATMSITSNELKDLKNINDEVVDTAVSSLDSSFSSVPKETESSSGRIMHHQEDGSIDDESDQEEEEDDAVTSSFIFSSTQLALLKGDHIFVATSDKRL